MITYDELTKIGKNLYPKVFAIQKNSERYKDIDNQLPDYFLVLGLNKEQADILAYRLSNWNAGCDYSWTSVGGEGSQD